MGNTVWPISSFQKKKKIDQTVFELRCTSQTFYQKLYVLNHIVLASILYKFPRKAPFSIFIKSCISFSIYTILNKLNQGQYGLIHTGWPILSFNHRQYGLTQIVHLEKIDQFL